MEAETHVDEATVRALARAANLPLAPGREESLAPQFGAWLAGATELNRKMSAREHWTVTPITVLTHPQG